MSGWRLLAVASLLVGLVALELGAWKSWRYNWWRRLTWVYGAALLGALVGWVGECSSRAL